MTRSKASRITTFIFGIIIIFGGIYCMLTPALTYMAIGYVVGINIILHGIGGIIEWNDRRKMNTADGWMLAGAIISLVFGALMVTSEALQLAVNMTVVYLAATWLIVTGIMRILMANRIRKAHRALQTEILGKRWWLIMVMGILMILFGVLSFFNPTGLVIAIGLNMGLNIVIAGADMITASV